MWAPGTAAAAHKPHLSRTEDEDGHTQGSRHAERAAWSGRIGAMADKQKNPCCLCCGKGDEEKYVRRRAPARARLAGKA